jgi:FixJ family two-component response regulator
MTTAPPARTHSLRIAIVDDEQLVRVSLRRYCSALGMNAVAYGGGRELLDALSSSSDTVDCLLLDAHMPDMTGLDVQQQLRRLAVPFPTIVYSADDEPEARERYLAAGAAEYLRKPVGGEELVAAIARAVESQRLARRAE